MTYENSGEDSYTENPWPNSILKRPAPGIGVEGRVWENINIDSLPTLVGDILRDAELLTVELTLNCFENSDSDIVVNVIINSTVAVPIDFGSANRIELLRYLQFMLEKNINDGENVSTGTYVFHNLGFFWQEMK